MSSQTMDLEDSVFEGIVEECETKTGVDICLFVQQHLERERAE